MTNFDRCGWCRYYNVWANVCSIKEEEVDPKNKKCKKFISWESLEED